jgi:predicted small lipoprotein YifL
MSLGLASRIALTAVAAVLVAGCGVRGSLEAPADARAQGTATSAESADAGANSAAAKKPHRDFILDGLVR